MRQSIDKRGLSERDICTKLIAPAFASSGWDLLTQIRDELDIPKSRITVRGTVFSCGKGISEDQDIIERLQAAFDQHGRSPQGALDQLDWPTLPDLAREGGG